MKITNAWLKKWNACKDGVEWFNAQKETDGIKVIEKLVKEDRVDWANWTICQIFDRKQKIKYAIYAAEQVIDIFEKEYPDDKRPREAIEAANKVLESDTKENRGAARYAAGAARYAADAAAYAAYADATGKKIIEYGIGLLEGNRVAERKLIFIIGRKWKDIIKVTRRVTRIFGWKPDESK